MDPEKWSKWFATVASIWIQCSCGASYAFGIYSPVLKSSQDYDQSTLDTVSVFKDIGANAGVLSGILFAAVADTSGRCSSSFLRGPWVVHMVGVLQCFAGYFFMWLSVTGAIPRPPVSIMCLFMFLAAHSQTFFNTANVVTAVYNFPEFSGTIVGIMKGFLGLSGAVLIQAYQTVFNVNPSTFLLMLASLPTVLILLLMLFVRIHQVHSCNDKKHLNGFSLVSLIVATYLMFLIILENTFTLPRWVQIISFALLLFLLSSPIKIAVKAQKEDMRRLSQAYCSPSRMPLISDPELEYPEKISAEKPRDNNEESSETVQNKTSASADTQQGGEELNLNLLQAMGTMNFWLLFIAMLSGMGSGLATINNVSQIGEALGYTAIERSTLVSLWSIWNFLGRIGAGYLSDVMLHRRGWARPLFMTLTLATMTAGHVVIASGFSGNLYIGSVLVGVCYGSQWSLMPTITSEIFGLQHMGTIFNTIAIASPVGSYLFSVRVIGFIYDKEAKGEGKSCYGTRCFMLSFFIMASVSLFGCLVALLLFLKTRSSYKRVLRRRLWHTARV